MARVALGGVWGQWQRGRYSHAQTRTCVSRTAAGECKRVAQCSARRLLSCTSIDMLPRPSTASRMVRSVGAHHSESTDCNARAARGFRAHARSPAAAATRRQTTHCMLSQKAQAWARKSFLRHGRATRRVESSSRSGMNWKCWNYPAAAATQHNARSHSGPPST